MFNIAICDDDENELKHIYTLVKQYEKNHPSIELSIDIYSSVEKLLEKNSIFFQYQLFLLDILMPVTSGIEFAGAIRSAGSNAEIIFVTSSKDFALDAFSVNAMQYILKPVSGQALMDALDKAVYNIKVQMAGSIIVYTTDGIKNIFYHNIIFIECVRHTVYFHLSDGSIISTKTLRQSFTNYIGTLLVDERFIRTHHSFVINKQHVVKLTSHGFQLSGDHLVPIARDRFSEVKSNYISYIDNRTEV